MIKILVILSFFLLGTTNAQLSLQPNNNSSPVSSLMEKLAVHTASIINELSIQLLETVERTISDLKDNIELITSSSLNQLVEPIQDLQKSLNSSKCQPLVSLEKLNQHIDKDLSKCMQNINTIVDTIQQDATEFKVGLEKSISDIIDLIRKCQNEENGEALAGSINCYINNIEDFNRQTAAILNKASQSLIHTRQEAEVAVRDARSCASHVIATAQDTVRNIMSDCQLTEQ